MISVPSVAQVFLPHTFMTNHPDHDPDAELASLRERVATLEGQLAAHNDTSLIEAAFEATADGLLVVNTRGQVVRFNQRFLQLWHIPPEVAAAAVGNNQILQAYVVDQLDDPKAFIARLQVLYADFEAESFDALYFKDGRVFERYSRPQRMEGAVVGRVWSFRDVTARVRAEEERAVMQAALLAELSTPLIPISDQVVLMPLIGTVDGQRAQRVMEILLSGVNTRRATMTIIDITGVPVADTFVASMLMQCAQAVRLLGAQVVLTGIRPEVAQLLVGLGVDLRGIVTRSTLQAGIAYALGR